MKVASPMIMPSPKSSKVRKPTKKKKPHLSAIDKAQNKIKYDHRAAIRASFRRAGFHRVLEASDSEFQFEGVTSDFDDIFVYENVVVLTEYTISASSNVGDHLKKKKLVYDNILAKPEEFLEFLQKKFPKSADQLASKYHLQQTIVKILYCSRYDFEEHHRENITGPIYMDYPAVRYFFAVSDAVQKSTRFELLNFLEINSANVGLDGKVSVSTSSNNYSGSLLPEAHSHFERGFKIVTFYADPEALLRTSYVLRKDGWRDSRNLYQRMISKKKIELIRTYLKEEKRVFINNVIVTLPSTVRPLDKDLKTIDYSTLKQTAPVTIKLPDQANTIGIIDGQHRIFAYHETVNDDPHIARLRAQQNLLVTGIIYPENLTPIEREKFEARLFLEINSTQTNAKSQLKQAIGLITQPFTSESIATRVMSQLAKKGALQGVVEQYFFDNGKLKTSSIISYGLKPLVKMSGEDSLFSVWSHAARDEVSKGRNDEALEEYVDYCTAMINRLLIAIKKNLSSGRWTTDPKVKQRVLSTTYVNSFLITLRLLIEEGKSLEEADLEKAFAGIDKLDFSKYHSSQYKRMAEEIVETHFGIKRNKGATTPTPNPASP